MAACGRARKASDSEAVPALGAATSPKGALLEFIGSTCLKCSGQTTKWVLPATLRPKELIHSLIHSFNKYL